MKIWNFPLWARRYRVTEERTFKLPAFSVRLFSFLILGASCIAPAYAGFITTPNLNPIFSQASFDTFAPITIDWLDAGPPVESPLLAKIDNAAELADLWSRALDASPIVDVFFVDAVNWCNGVPNPGFIFVGCGQLPGHLFTVDSTFVSTNPLGAVDIAHELGHNLNLPHVGIDTSVGNLMNPTLNSDVLTVAQVQTLFGSSLIQGNLDTGYFIDLRPIAVIPEPGTFALLVMAMAMCLTLLFGRLRPRSRVEIFA